MLIKLFLLLGLISNIVWVFPVYIQRKGRYSAFFTYMAIAALLEIITKYAGFTNYMNFVVVFFLVLLAYSIIYPRPHDKVHYPVLFLGFVLVGLLLLLRNHAIELSCIIIECLIIVGALLRRLIIETTVTHSFSLFTSVLLFNELSMIMRAFFALTRTNVGIKFYVFSLLFEMVCGMFFMVFSEENSRLSIRIKSE